MKGAVERVLRQCTCIYVPENVHDTLQLDERGVQAVMHKVREYGRKGFRGNQNCIHIFTVDCIV